MKPQMQSVQSSQVKEIGYDKENKRLWVTFNTHTTYTYDNVPEEVYNRMLASESVGKFLNSDIKGKYEYKKQV